MKNSDLTLVLIPGLLSDSIVWQPTADALSDSMNVYIADVSAGISLTAVAEDILSQTSGPLCVAGHSMGARIAMEMVRLAPDRVDKLALLDTGTHLPSDDEIEKRQVLVDKLNAEGMSSSDDWLLPMVHEDRHDDSALMDALRAMLKRADPAQFERQVKALLNRRDGAITLKQTRCPTLVLVGRQDAWSPVSQHEEMMSHLLDARLVVVENSGHFAPIERPEAVIAALKDWLSGW